MQDSRHLLVQKTRLSRNYVIIIRGSSQTLIQADFQIGDWLWA